MDSKVPLRHVLSGICLTNSFDVVVNQSGKNGLGTCTHDLGTPYQVVPTYLKEQILKENLRLNSHLVQFSLQAL